MNDAEREKIREEEIFREETRKALQPPRKPREAILAFFNSGVGLWLLGTVAATAISLIYAYAQETFKTRTERELLEQKLSYEAMIRIQQWESQMVAIKTAGGSRTEEIPITPEEFKRHWTRLLAPPAANDRSVTSIYALYPEYDRRGLLSVVFELSELLKSTSKRESHKEVERIAEFLVTWDPLLNRYDTLEKYFEVLRNANLGMEFSNRAGKYSRKPDDSPSPGISLERDARVPPPPPPPPKAASAPSTAR